MPLTQEQQHTARVGALAVSLDRMETMMGDELSTTDEWQSFKELLFSLVPELDQIQDWSRNP